MAATIKDIAKRLNISTSTVSYALNGGPRTVPDEVRQRVLDVARELDYRPNRLAKSLVTRVSNTVGVVPPAVGYNVFLSPFVRLAWNALVNEAENLGQDLLLFTGHDRNSPDEPGIELLDGRIDCCVFIAPRPDARAVESLADRSFPLTMIASGESKHGPRFTCDNAGGVRQALEHLVSLGHRRIGHITGGDGSADARIRSAAFEAESSRLGLDVHPGYVQHGTFTIDSGYAAGRGLLMLREHPTAVFVSNDEMAYGLCLALREAGLEVPRDLSIVGFDDCDMSHAFNPPITTIQQPVAQMSAAALRAAVGQARGESNLPGADFPTRLIVRGSTAPAGEMITR